MLLKLKYLQILSTSSSLFMMTTSKIDVDLSKHYDVTDISRFKSTGSSGTLKPILQIRLLIHESQTPPGPNRFTFNFTIFQDPDVGSVNCHFRRTSPEVLLCPERSTPPNASPSPWSPPKLWAIMWLLLSEAPTAILN